MQKWHIQKLLVPLAVLCMVLFHAVSAAGETQDFTITVDEPGEYALALTYRIDEGSMQDATVTVAVNAQVQDTTHEKIILPAMWKDDTQDYAVNRFGNDLYPRPEHLAETQTYALRESIYHADEPLHFALAAGENRISVTIGDGAISLFQISACKLEVPAPFAEYATQLPRQRTAMTEVIVIEGEHYAWKSLSSIRGGRSRSTQLHPYDAAHNRINALDGSSSCDPGSAVTWTFTVPEDGLYYLGLRYQQDTQKDMNVYKTIWVDGETVTDALSAYAFGYTGSSVRNAVLTADGTEIPFYLTAGDHTVTFISTAAPYAQIHQALQKLVTQMNDLALDIKIISGNKTDKNRDWQLEYYLPNVRSRLEQMETDVAAIYDSVEAVELGKADASFSTLLVVKEQIHKFLTDKDGLDDLVNELDNFAQASGSLSESVALLIPGLLKQPLTIDRLYVLSDPKQLPRDGMNLLRSAWEEVHKTVLSFFIESDTAQSNEADALNVWMIGSAQEMEILREMVDRSFPGESINISLTTSESKVQLAIAADKSPDVVMGGSMGFAYQLGVRGAVCDLTQFADFETFRQNFYAETFVPATLNDQVYALPQTLELWLLFCRDDILSSLGLNVPQTWDDVIEMLPTLYRYGMNFNTVPAYGGALKNLTSLSPLILENGGHIYAQDGMSVSFTDAEFIKGFTLLTDLYTKYGVSTSISNFYSSFRNGTVPIGISGLGTYVLLREEAQNLDGLWSVALLPGVQTEEGINRAHPAVSTGCMILSDSQRQEEAWRFLSWWMSAEVQNEFASRLQTSYGSEYVWVTANQKALETSGLFSNKDKAVILAQLACMQENPSHPAATLVERALSNAWNDVVFSSNDVRSALDSAQLEADRGIVRKLQQFGYINEMGEIVESLWQEGTN